jgi:hypothetical protein
VFPNLIAHAGASDGLYSSAFPGIGVEFVDDEANYEFVCCLIWNIGDLCEFYIYDSGGLLSSRRKST